VLIAPGPWILAGGALAAPAALELEHLRPAGPGTVIAHGLRLRTDPAVVVEVEESHSMAWPAGTRALGGPFFRVPASEPLDAARAWARRPGVASAFPDVAIPRRAMAEPMFDDPNYGGQWYMEALGMEAAWAITRGDPAVRAAVIDSAIDIDSAELGPAVVEPYDAFSDDDDPRPEPGVYCAGNSEEICDEHGTAVSAIVAARADNGVLVVGMCPECSLVPIRMLGEGAGQLSADVAAFEHALATDAGVVNNSWGYTEAIAAPRALQEAIARVVEESRGGLGGVVVFAAGNDDREIIDGEPCTLDGVLCVAATDSYGNPTNYTNFGPAIDLAAPSATVTIAPGDALLTTFGGTSAASPVAAGFAAWMLSARPDLSAAEVLAAMTDTAYKRGTVKFDDEGHSDDYGQGELDPAAVIDALGLGPRVGDTGSLDSGSTGEVAGEDAMAPEGCACGSRGRGAWAWVGGVLAAAGARSRRRR
jgi:hypothetical protein